ncbi:MAG: carbon starvation CstA family protein, partial [Candidatus Margulisiibacteriota bacterium]|nr:carbon starvation CstA family protein [Candidatus Margulisiibacteriota bacterium]
MVSAISILFTSYVCFAIAYKVYGKFLAKKVFDLNSHNQMPSHALNDGVDYVPSQKGMVFGHHFTSIAGTGPIVGPAIGVIWGWLPALIWVVFGSILMGAVHDFGVLVISLRHKGRSICDFADQFVSKKVQLIFFIIVCFALWIVIAIFGLIIAIVFDLFPQSVIPVWFEIPVAIAFGYTLRRFPSKLLILSIIALLLM